MRTNFTVSLAKIISEFSLETLNMPANPEKIQISTTEVNRPGLHMAGYFEFFDEKRIQIIGKSEESFLLRFTPEKAEKRLREFFSHKPVAVVICRNMQVDEVYAKTAAEYGVPLLRTAETTLYLCLDSLFKLKLGAAGYAPRRFGGGLRRGNTVAGRERSR